PDLTVHATDHLEIPPVRMLRRLAHWTERVEALRARELHIQLLEIARRDIVQRQVARNRGHRLRRSRMTKRLPDEHADLALVLHTRRRAREHERSASPDRRRRRLQEQQRLLRHLVAQLTRMRGIVAPNADDLAGPALVWHGKSVPMEPYAR